MKLIFIIYYNKYKNKISTMIQILYNKNKE